MLILVYISCHMYTCTHFNYGNIFIFIAVSNILEVHVTVQCPLDLYCIVHTDKSMLGTFPKAFSQAATSQGYFPKWQLHWEIVTWEVALGKMPLGKHLTPINRRNNGLKGL